MVTFVECRVEFVGKKLDIYPKMKLLNEFLRKEGYKYFFTKKNYLASHMEDDYFLK